MTFEPIPHSLLGRRLGVYEVQNLLGAGGMGEVYRARDTKLGRDVALKVLPRAFTADANSLVRFEREARVLASLNHPRIGAIYGFVDAPATDTGPGIKALVLELVEGDTLAERIANRPSLGGPAGLPLADALSIARQIAEALDAAHEKGIVHRDLKPANVKTTPDGGVKVLDFGLAKTTLAGPSDANLSQLPTATVGPTRDGTILGTAAYMSPEQARGQAVDKRTDIWAFGCVLYEMLTGRKAFAGATFPDTLAAVLEREPDWTALPAATPQAVALLIRRCLRKDPQARLRDIADARIAIDELNDLPLHPGGGLGGSSRSIGRSRVAVVTTVALLIGGAVGWIVNARLARSGASGATASEVRLQIPTPPTTDPASLAISPDGSHVVFVATAQGVPQLWLRPLAEVTARPLAGTTNAGFPFWSPDGTAIGFFADRLLKRIDVGTGTVQALAPAEGGRGGSWNLEGTIVFQPAPGNTPLRTVRATGGESREMAVGVGRFPQFLPDGRSFVYSRTAGAQTAEIRGLYVGSLDGGEPKPLIDSADSAGVYSPSGHVLFVRQGTLFAQSLDLFTLTTTGVPFPVAGGMSVNGPLWLSPLSVSAAGPIAYRTGSAGGFRQLVWFDRTGREISRVGDPIPNSLSPVLSPDGQRVAFHRSTDGNTDIWILDSIRSAVSRFTTGAGAEYHPVWSPDGRRLLFSAGQDLVIKPVVGSGSQAMVLKPGASPTATDWSSDGGLLLFTTNEPNPSRDIWAASLKDNKQHPVARTRFNEQDGQFSSDGKWVAYTSDESGRDEVYAQRFPEPTDRVQISTAGGGMARWRRDGRELLYIGLDGRLMAVTLRTGSGATSLEPGPPAPLFPTRIGPAVQPNSKHQYMPAPDGQRFLMNMLAEENAAPITVILNWRARP